MLQNYLRLAWKVLLRRKFFTFISLFGISFTLVVLMLATAILDHVIAAYPPETKQNRTVGIYYAALRGDRARRNGMAGFRLLDTYARNLPNVEKLSIAGFGGGAFSYLNGQRVKSHLKRTDGAFWEILDFTFVEGHPYTESDVRDGRLVAVINESTRRRFFGASSAAGRTLEVDGQRFTVVGVVPDVPVLRVVPFADIWVPYTTEKSDGFRTELVGNYIGILLLHDPAKLALTRDEFWSRLRTITPSDRMFKTVEATPETLVDTLGRMFVGSGSGLGTGYGAKLAAVLVMAATVFMLLPAVNLMNLNTSRILERASEIGVRKAFGASSRVLVGQFLVENVVLTLVGAALGFVLAAWLLRAVNASGIIQYASLQLNYRIFAWGVGLAVAFGLLSGVYPAWRMSRLHPVEALKGGLAMIRHLFTLIWNRKRTNVLMMTEIFVSFLVLFAVVALGVYMLDNWRRPIGFSIDRVWNVSVDMKQVSDDYFDASQQESVRQLFFALGEFPEIERVAGTMLAPYQFGSSNSSQRWRNRDIEFGVAEVTDEFKDVLGLKLVQGRWFGPEDDGQSYDAVVINQTMSRDLFGSESAVGQNIAADEPRPGATSVRPSRVVGVVDAYREDGEFDGTRNYVIFRKPLRGADPKSRPPRNLLIKVRTGTTAALEERLIKRLQAAAPGWSFEVTRLEQMREDSIRFAVAPLIAVGLVAGFLMLMVALGLFGVLWQAVTQRTRELGLRRAKGASKVNVRRQILGEIGVMTGLALAVGLLVVVQFPLLNVIYFVDLRVYLIAFILSAATIVALTLLCGWYPSHVATRIEPAEALRYE